jgi:SAM-dependent methyltransferase
MTTYKEVTTSLREFYARNAAKRDTFSKEAWKVEERRGFLERLRLQQAERLLEIGAGTGQDSVFFKENGLSVIATDLTPEMVAWCRQKGLDAHVRDFLDLGFPPASFDAVYALNCLLHVPNADIPVALRSVYEVLRPGGLFFLSTYAIDGEHEGIWEQDNHETKRFFSFRSDDRMRGFVQDAGFEVVDLHRRELDRGFRTQTFTLLRPA